MNRLFQCLLVIVVFGAFASAHAAVAAPQEQGEPGQLVRAQIGVEVTTPVRALVQAFFVVVGSDAPVILLPELPGQQLEVLRVDAGGIENVPFTDERRSSALRALRLEAVAGFGASEQTIAIAYRLEGTDAAAYRFALPVPTAVPTGEERSVQVNVTLPAGVEFAGNAFPPMTAGDRGRLEATLVAVPSLVHVVFGDAGVALWTHVWLEWLTMGIAAAALVGGWYWNRRRVAQAEA